jgi:hypothetical protein
MTTFMNKSAGLASLMFVASTLTWNSASAQSRYPGGWAVDARWRFGETLTSVASDAAGASVARAVEFLLRFPFEPQSKNDDAMAVCRVETSEFKSWFEPILLKQLTALAPAAKLRP